MPSDLALLEQWMANRDAEAFRAIVLRHGGMVYHTCRRILRSDEAAEEVAQECFTTLAVTRKRPTRHLGAWLHRVAAAKAINRVRSEQRRKAREQAYAAVRDSVIEPQWDDVFDAVDEALLGLPDKYREVLLLHYFEGRSHAAIARDQGCKRTAVTYRVNRGVALLRKQLRRKGIPVGVPALAAMLTEHAEAGAPPEALAGNLARIALSGAKGAAPVALATPKIRAGAMAIVLGVVLTGAWFMFRGALGGEEVLVDSAADHSREAQTMPGPEDAPVEPAKRVVRAGQSLAHDATGLIRQVVSRAQPEEEPGARSTISGVVLDESGYPVSEASIVVNVREDHGMEQFVERSNHYWATTNQDGQYVADILPFWPYSTFAVRASAPGMVCRSGPRRVTVRPEETTGGVDFILHRGATLRGRVVTSGEEPVTDAVVSDHAFSRESGGSRQGKAKLFVYTDEEGVFEMVFEERGVAVLNVCSPTHGPGVFADVPVGSAETIELVLTPAGRIVGRLTWADGKPASGLELTCSGGVPYDNSLRLAHPWFVPRAPADDNGDYVLEGLPANCRYTITVRQPGDGDTLKLLETKLETPLSPGESRRHDMVLDRPGAHAIVRGHVLGLASRQPIAHVRAVPMRDGVVADHDGGRTDEDGAYELRILDGPGHYTLVPDYEMQWVMHDSLLPYGEETDVPPDEIPTVDLYLPDPFDQSIRLTDRRGQPIADAAVTLSQGPIGHSGLTTDDNGVFVGRGIPPGHDYTFAIAKDGYVKRKETFPEVEPGEQPEPVTIVLDDAGGLEGTAFTVEGTPLADAPISITVHSVAGGSEEFDCTTDASGAFAVLDGVPATTLRIALETTLATGDSSAPQAVRLRAVAEEVECSPGYMANLGEVVFEANLSE